VRGGTCPSQRPPPPPPSPPPDTPLTGLVGVGVAVCMMEAPSGHVHGCVWVGERSLAISHSHPSGGVDSGGGLVLGTLTDGSVADVAPVAAFQGGVTALCSGYLSDDVRNAIVSATPPPTHASTTQAIINLIQGSCLRRRRRSPPCSSPPAASCTSVAETSQAVASCRTCFRPATRRRSRSRSCSC
jgi:hypothetical protein